MDRRTSRTQPNLALLLEAPEPTFVESFSIPWGDIQLWPLDHQTPFHAHGYTNNQPLPLGRFTTIEEAREAILDYAAQALSLLFGDPRYQDLRRQFISEEETNAETNAPS